MLGGVGIPHVIRRENGVLLGETRGGGGREVSSGESFSGALSQCYDGVFSGGVCGDHLDLDSWGVAREDELSCVDAVCASLAYFFVHRHCL